MTEVYLGPPAHHDGMDNLPIVRLVVHATCPGMHDRAASGSDEARATARYFQSQSATGSAHFVADVDEAVRCAPDAMVCWHAPPNRHSLGYEICGEVGYSREDWLSPEVWPAVKRVAAMIRRDAQHYGVPLVRLSVAEVKAGKAGICGHVDVSKAFGLSDHSDPGPGFPWDRFMAEVAGAAAPADEEDIVASLDDLRTVVQQEVAKAVAQLHADHKIILHGDDTHVASVDAIAKAVKVPGA